MFDVSAYLGHFAFRQLRHNTGSGLVRLMDRFGISRAAVSSAAAITYRNPQSGNEELATEVEAHRSRRDVLATIDPFVLEVCRLDPRLQNSDELKAVADPELRAFAES